MKALIIISILLLAVFFLGCEDETTRYVSSDGAPATPQGVYSITGDERVTIYWLPVQDGDLEEYRVWWSNDDSLYYFMDATTETFYVDDSVTNGITYYYAVSAVDRAGNESDLSYEMVFDTPRSAGINIIIFDYNDNPEGAGFDFSSADSTIPYNSDSADIYLEYDTVQSTYYFHTANDTTGIQDVGYTYDFDEMGYAPEFGWSTSGTVEGILGHTYVIKTGDRHYAKIRVDFIITNPRGLMFDWAYQDAVGNRELAPPHNDEDDNSSNIIDGQLLK